MSISKGRVPSRRLETAVETELLVDVGIRRTANAQIDS